MRIQKDPWKHLVKILVGSHQAEKQTLKEHCTNSDSVILMAPEEQQGIEKVTILALPAHHLQVRNLEMLYKKLELQ